MSAEGATDTWPAHVCRAFGAGLAFDTYPGATRSLRSRVPLATFCSHLRCSGPPKRS